MKMPSAHGARSGNWRQCRKTGGANGHTKIVGVGMRKNSVVRCALAALVLALTTASELFAAAPGSVTVNVESKRASGTLLAMQNGDIACMLTLRDERGIEFTEPADFDICAQKPALIGQRVVLTYTTANVMAASCQGDVACKKSERIAIVAGIAVDRATAIRDARCVPPEKTVFTCATGASVVSVCASADLSSKTGYAQYRFGKPDKAPDLILPQTFQHPARVAYGQTEAFSGGGGAWLRFRQGAHGYVVFTGIGKWGPGGATAEKAGIVVERDGKRIAALKCRGKVQSELGPDWFQLAGFVPRNEEFDFPD